MITGPPPKFYETRDNLAVASYTASWQLPLSQLRSLSAVPLLDS